MPPLKDLSGKRYGYLTVLGKAGHKGNMVTWECVCNCGNSTIVVGSALSSGHTKSCGCLRKEGNGHASHRMRKNRLYSILANMKTRCYNPSVASYKNYGGRGITICDEWMDNPETFFKWALANGYKDDLTIERIDVNKGYSPENCTWISRSEQSSNTRSCHYITYNGKTQNISRWCRELGLPYRLVRTRITKCGWTFERAISEPIHNKGKMAREVNFDDPGLL